MNPTLNEMMRGVAPLEQLARTLSLTPAQRLRVRLLHGVVAAWRQWLRRSHRARAKREAFQLELRRHTGLTLRGRHPDLPGLRARSAHALSDDAVAAFEREGVLGPFEVLPPSEAEALAEHLDRWHEPDLTPTSVFPTRIQDVFRRAGTWSLAWSSHFQAHRKRPLWELVTSAPIAHRVASLLGEDVLCWRTQAFPKPPGAPGTFWHQASVFREAAKRPKLAPPPACPPGMAQLTVWVALRDVTMANGALRILPGTFADSRLEALGSYAQDHLLPFLAEVPPERLDAILRVGLYSSGSFGRAQAIFDATLSQLEGLFDDREVRDLTLRAGQAVVFSSLNVHGSYANTTTDQHRLAFAGRYTAGDVAVFPDGPFDN
ncbi:MAG: phytanoyl-CoA dioxygenase family protein, partial [Myxococcales bacterium]|nr:phytanoyl-CoA dioxygenase family protein [Myxococcales bacterium]